MEVADTFLSLARNVHMRKGFPTRINGRRVAYDSTNGNALHLLNLSLNTFNWWMLFGASTIRAAEGSNLYDISMAGQLAVSNPREWSSALLNGIPVFTNGKNLPSYWVGLGGTPAATLPGWPAGTVCAALATFKFHIFALNIDGPGGTFPNQVLWSDAAQPGALPLVWTSAPSNEAGDTILADTVGRCVTGLALNEQLFIYKPQSFYIGEYVGQPGIFKFRAGSRTIGAVGPNAVIEIDLQGVRHLIVGNDDVVINDGVSTRSIADNRIKNYLANSIDETNAGNAFIINDVNRKEVWVCVPETGSQFATIAHVWDRARDNWVTRDLNQVRYGTTGYVLDNTPSDVWDNAVGVWDTDTQLWNAGNDGAIQRVLTSEALELYLEDSTDVTSVTSVLQKLDMTFDDETLDKLTQRVYIEGSGRLTNIQFRLGSRDSTDEPIVWGNYVTRQSHGKPYEVHGKFISLEITITSTDIWTIDRVTIIAVPNGSF
jgi:hypothetical protein